MFCSVALRVAERRRLIYTGAFGVHILINYSLIAAAPMLLNRQKTNPDLNLTDENHGRAEK